MLEGGKYRIQFWYARDLYNKPHVTHCCVEVGGKPYTGEAICHDLDNFNKETGRKIALGRAIAPLDVTERTIIWHLYLMRGQK